MSHVIAGAHRNIFMQTMREFLANYFLDEYADYEVITIALRFERDFLYAPLAESYNNADSFEECLKIRSCIECYFDGCSNAEKENFVLLAKENPVAYSELINGQFIAPFRALKTA